MAIRVLSAGAVQCMMEALGPEFETASGERLDIEFATVGALRKRLEAGEEADLVALSESAVAALNGSGRFVPGSVTNLGQSVTGVAVRTGAPNPDISTVDAFNRTLLAARTVSHPDPKGGGSSGIYLAEYFKKAGLADAIGAKAVLGERGHDVAHLIAAGKAEIGMTFISEFLPVPGVTVVGPLPPGIECVNMYTAAIPASSRQQAKAAAFLAALTDPATRGRWKAAGLDPAF
ncbi:MAG: molybdate ABC transporter substrate-binding protein [Pseudolabrys sp.]